MSSVRSVSPVDLPKAKPDLRVNRKPSSRLGAFLWRWRVWFETTFVLSMLEPWEKILLLTMLAFFVLLASSAVFKYMPNHLTIMSRRAVYYLWGSEGNERAAWQKLGFGSAGLKA